MWVIHVRFTEKSYKQYESTSYIRIILRTNSTCTCSLIIYYSFSRDFVEKQLGKSSLIFNSTVIIRVVYFIGINIHRYELSRFREFFLHSQKVYTCEITFSVPLVKVCTREIELSLKYRSPITKKLI